MPVLFALFFFKQISALIHRLANGVKDIGRSWKTGKVSA